MTIVTRGAGQWIVPSTTTVGKVYLVKLFAGQHLTCDCMGHFHYGRCKHADAVAATLPKLLAEAGPTAADTAAIFMAHRTPR